MLIQFFHLLLFHHYQDTPFIEKGINNNNLCIKTTPVQTQPLFRYNVNIFLRDNYQIFSQNNYN
jgi:hypothetical protein